MAHYRIIEWDQYQHYKDRDPPWIKLHRDTLTSRTWVSVDDRGRVLAIACMLIAAGTNNKIPADPAFVRRRAYLDYDPDFRPLVDAGFIEKVGEINDLVAPTQADASTMLANGTECSSEREQRRAEKSRGERASRASTIPDDWKPDAELFEYARQQGCRDPADTFERFRLHHGGKGTKHKNWTMAAQLWCRNEKSFGGHSRASPAAKQPMQI